MNKVETKVTLRFSIPASRVLGERRRSLLLTRLAGRLTQKGELLVTASRHREQMRNREEARERLARILAEALRSPKVRKRTRPTRASSERRLREKRRRGERKRERRGKGEE